jgi:hypothetical protein
VKLKVVSQRNFLCNCFCFFYTYCVGIAVIARLPTTASGISSESLDYFIIRFLSFYQINATKVEKIGYYTRFISRTVTLVLLEYSTASTNRVTIKRLIKLE